MGHLLSLQVWVPEAAIYEKFGEVLEVENPESEGRLLRTFIRVRARVDIKKPMVIGCWVPRKSLPKVWIMFRYERLQGLCFNCGIIGHEQKSCRQQQALSPLDHKTPKYSSRLGVPPPRTMLQLIQEQEAWNMYSNRKTNSENWHQGQNSGTNQPATAAMAHPQNSEGQEHQGSQPSHTADKNGGRTSQHTSVAQQSDLDEVVVDKSNFLVQQIREGQHPQTSNLHPEKAPDYVPTISTTPPMETKKDKQPALNLEAEATVSTPYFVEFPDDEDNDNFVTIQQNQLHAEEESKLIVGWNRALSLKRRREGTTPHFEEQQEAEYTRAEQKTRRVLEWKTGGEIEGTLEEIKSFLSGDSLVKMVEEEGLSMPHHQP
ncbi:Zinc finger, CCHC-type [Sesbania bispinosa]|nr:Zinc finger, CCHC-type [Sesbania bispinosa]